MNPKERLRRNLDGKLKNKPRLMENLKNKEYEQSRKDEQAKRDEGKERKNKKNKRKRKKYNNNQPNLYFHN